MNRVGLEEMRTNKRQDADFLSASLSPPFLSSFFKETPATVGFEVLTPLLGEVGEGKQPYDEILFFSLKTFIQGNIMVSQSMVRYDSSLHLTL